MSDDKRLVPGDLPSLWRERADYLREYGDPNSARLWLLAAVELERALEVFGAETLSLTEAAEVSGYSAGYLGSLVKRRTIPNAGRKGAPRIRRADVPLKRPNGPGRPARPTQEQDEQNAGDLTPITRSKRGEGKR